MEATQTYDKIKEAIAYIIANRDQQPSLAEVAEAMKLSESHFQRLFTTWVGTSPKQFLKYINVNYAKYLMQRKAIAPTLFDITEQLGLSSSSRLHDLFVSIECMTPGEYANGGKHLDIAYSEATTMFGNVVIASTTKGICHVSFIDTVDIVLVRLQTEYPNARFTATKNKWHEQVCAALNNKPTVEGLKLHLKGTPFQLKVWEALLTIPAGKLTTYGHIAEQIGNAKASRAVGTAIGKNPISYIIPCHRVIQQSGLLGGYMWGPDRKRIILGWELAQAARE